MVDFEHHQNHPSPSSSAVSGGDLRPAISDISSLISLSHTIRVFPIKWQTIRTKLEQLNSCLITTHNCHSTTTNPLHHLLSTLAATMASSHDLANRCITLNFSGKLLMQSDLDLVISKLDSLIKSISVMFNNVGVLSNGFALVVSKPSSTASKDDVKFYIKDLLTRIKIGDCDMKHQALVSLNEIVIQDEKFVKIVVEMEDLVIQIANFVDSNDSRVQEEAVQAIELVSRMDYYHGVLVCAGVIASLVRVIETGTLRAKQDALRSLKELTSKGDNAWALSAHGGVTSLLGICSREPSNGELAGLACWVLRNLVVVDEIKRFMIEEGGIKILIEMIKAKDELGLISSSETIQAMANGDDLVRRTFVKDGGIRAFIRVIDPKSMVSFKSREIALKAIENLCYPCSDYVNLLLSYGFMEHILWYLRNGEVSIQELAFKSANRLCCSSEEARKVMGETGFMSEFVKFLEAKSYEIREMAAEALCNLVTVPKNRKKFAQEDENIGLILQLLDSKEGNAGNFKFLLSILLSISNCNHARRKIAHSGYVKNIEKLADSGVSDAKMLVRKLSTNRFRSLLNGIWHS